MTDPGPRSPPIRVGNDVVDLRHPRVRGKEEDHRFLSRILLAEERKRVAREGPPSLWLHWAAKEAAYKVVCKEPRSRPAFRHRSFRVEPGAGPPTQAREGRVWYGGVAYPFQTEVSGEEGWLHVVALAQENGGTSLESVGREVALLPDGPADWRRLWRGRFTEAEWRSVHSFPSAAARIRAREALAGPLQLSEGDLEIVTGPGPIGRAPPVLLVGGRPFPGDISLSHHGRFVAWSAVIADRQGADHGR